jgi:uncharacterized lipoprotein
MKYRFVGGVVVCLILAACASAPVARQIQNSFPVDQPFENVWTATIETFAELNLPILNMEKASGLITTDWIQLNDPTMSDCGKQGVMSSEQGRRVKFNVFVKTVGGDACEMKINAMFETMVATYGNSGLSAQTCVSTGKFEKQIYDMVTAKVK